MEKNSFKISSDIVLKSNTPEELQQFIEKTNKASSKSNSFLEQSTFSPYVDKKLLSMKSLSPEGLLIPQEKGKKDLILTRQMAKIKELGNSDYLVYEGKKGKFINKKYYKWDSKEARNLALKNLRSKKKIQCNDIIGPKQYKANCWFNSFFVAFFLSDKGRKFHRWFRETMITGFLANGESIPESLKKPLFLFNSYIEASLRSEYSVFKFAKLMDTNNIIQNIYDGIKSIDSTLSMPKVNQFGNPYTFYMNLYKILGGDMLSFIKISFSSGNEKFYTRNKCFGLCPCCCIDLYGKEEQRRRTEKTDINLKGGSKKTVVKSDADKLIDKIKEYVDKTNGMKLPEVIFVEVFDQASEKFEKSLTFSIAKEGKIYTYILDSITLRNTNQHHFSSYITCNDEEFAFDGEGLSRMIPFKWKNKINTPEFWQFEYEKKKKTRQHKKSKSKKNDKQAEKKKREAIKHEVAKRVIDITIPYKELLEREEKRKQQLDMPTSELVFCFTKGYQLLTYYLSSIKKST